MEEGYEETDQLIIEAGDEEEAEVEYDYEQAGELEEGEMEEAYRDKRVSADEVDLEHDTRHVIQFAREMRVPDKFRTSRPVLSKYERTRLLAIRVQQLKSGAPPMLRDIEKTKNMTEHEIALAELDMRILPFKIKRFKLGGKYELWRLREFIMV